MHNESPIKRRKSTRIYVGNVPIGDGAPIAVQSMTNTKTTDVDATVKQIRALERVGVDIVRVSVPPWMPLKHSSLLSSRFLCRWSLIFISTIALR
jgi:(E)-4-hydroxy-3-methylbut-2-enyl-diphosphate synthase